MGNYTGDSCPHTYSIYKHTHVQSECWGQKVLQHIHPHHWLQYTSVPGYRPHRLDLIPIIMTTVYQATNQSPLSLTLQADWFVPAACCGMLIFNLSSAMYIAYILYFLSADYSYISNPVACIVRSVMMQYTKNISIDSMYMRIRIKY